MNKLPLIILLIFISITAARADKCADYLLLDGTEPIAAYGIDTTGHWWALTAPFTGSYRLTIDGEESDVYTKITNLHFSPDGSGWAYFGLYSGGWNLVTRDSIIPLRGGTPGEIAYSPDGYIVYSYFEGELETIINGEEKFEVYRRAGPIYLSHRGRKIAFAGRRGNGYVLNINGRETPVFDKIVPFGYWQDGSLVYGAGSVGNMEIYRRGRVISEPYANIHEAAINYMGTVAGGIVEFSSGEYGGIVISDEFYEPLLSRLYDKAYNMALHPTLPMMAFNAIEDNTSLVVMNTAEYSGGEVTGRPHFTYDGRDLYYVGCDAIDCFVGVNGRNYEIYKQLNVRANYAMKPKSNTIAYSGGTNMIMQDLISREMYAGMMVDETQPPIYNWREGVYEALGRIGNRLYLLTCRA
ncbi:MAG: hypothetical protein ACLFQX_05805 [Candidatus Kapaibacterium sp.]